MENTNSHVVKATGFLIGYFIFTTMFFLIGSLIGKIPQSWSFPEVALLSASLIGSGGFLKWWLS